MYIFLKNCVKNLSQKKTITFMKDFVTNGKNSKSILSEHPI